MQIKTFEEAIKRIKELEKENSALKEENKKLRSRNFGGRKKHNEAWMASYNDFATKYENGMSIVEIVSEGEISRRTAYRYLAYYREIKNRENDNEQMR